MATDRSHLWWRLCGRPKPDRAKRLPEPVDLDRYFPASLCYLFHDYAAGFSYGFQGAEEAWEALREAHKAEAALAGQPCIEGSDLYILRQAAWAAFDMALELDRLDQQICRAAGDKLDGCLWRELWAHDKTLERRRELRQRGHERALDWVAELADPAAKSWFMERLQERERLSAEVVQATDLVRDVCARAIWISRAPRIETLPVAVREPLWQLRREQLEQADKLTAALAQAVAETTGLPATAAFAAPLEGAR